MKIATVQTKPIPGDLEGNFKKIISYIEKAKADNAKLIIFSNGAICGINIKGLINDPTFIEKAKIINDKLLNVSYGIDIVIPTLTDYKDNFFE